MVPVAALEGDSSSREGSGSTDHTVGDLSGSEDHSLDASSVSTNHCLDSPRLKDPAVEPLSRLPVSRSTEPPVHTVSRSTGPPVDTDSRSTEPPVNPVSRSTELPVDPVSRSTEPPVDPVSRSTEPPVDTASRSEEHLGGLDGDGAEEGSDEDCDSSEENEDPPPEVEMVEVKQEYNFNQEENEGDFPDPLATEMVLVKEEVVDDFIPEDAEWEATEGPVDLSPTARGGSPAKKEAVERAPRARRRANRSARRKPGKEEEKGFKCPKCTYTCAKVWRLRRHERIHEGDKLHSCYLCGFQVASQAYLSRHMSTHKKF